MPRYDLEPVVPPALPIAPPQYNQSERDKYSNVLRLYFNRLSSFIQNLISSGGGKVLDFPNGAFSDDRNFVLNATTVAAPVRLDTTNYSNGVSLITDTVSNITGSTIFGTVDDGGGMSGNLLQISGVITKPGYPGMVVSMTGLAAGTYITQVLNIYQYRLSSSALLTSRAVTITGKSKIQTTSPGRYNFQFSIQFVNLDNALQEISVWFRHNGTDIANSNSEFGLHQRKSAGVPSRTIGSLNFFYDMEADDYMQIMWRTSNVQSSIEAFPAVTASGTSPAIPATPSVIVTVSFVSRLANT